MFSVQFALACLHVPCPDSVPQWFALSRAHALLAVADGHVREALRRYCYTNMTRNHPTCVSDEHWLPSLLATYGLDNQTDCEVSTVQDTGQPVITASMAVCLEALQPQPLYNCTSITRHVPTLMLCTLLPTAVLLM